MTYLKIYNRNHILIDELSEYSGLRYSWTLNATGKLDLEIPLENIKCTPENFKCMNQIEIWNDSTIVWWGVIVQLAFQDTTLNVNCFDYWFYWTKVIEFPYTFNDVTVADIVNTLIADVNFFRGNNDFSLGNVDIDLLKIENSFFDGMTNSGERLKQVMERFNYDFFIDSSKKINIYKRKGEMKDYYTLQYGTDADNIIVSPTLTFSAMDMFNIIRVDADEAFTTQKNNESIAQYGKLGLYDEASSALLSQNDLDNEVNAKLQRISNPTGTIELTAIDSNLCPFSDIELGDSIKISIPPYWGYSETQRIIEFEHDEMNGQRRLVVGQSIYRPQAPQKKIYAR